MSATLTESADAQLAELRALVSRQQEEARAHVYVTLAR